MGVTMLRAINVQAASPQLLIPAQEQIINLLRQRHHITPGKDDDFTVRTQQEIADAATAQSKTMSFLLAIIAGVSLVVGGIGIMNIMLVTVTERTREIGVRKAIGARRSEILYQFLIEAGVISCVGSLFGILIALAIPAAVRPLLPGNLQVPVPWLSVALAFLVACSVGLFFGYLPASKAAQLPPTESLRYE
jgi:putative ABC transport system permease protein